jgi:hypothetical protein
MIRTILVSIAVVGALAGCGSDSKSSKTSSATDATSAESSSDPTSAAPADDHAAAVAAFAIEQAKTAGFNYDADCVAGVVAKLNDADLELLYTSTLDTSPDPSTPELSADGQALSGDLFACAKTGGADHELVDSVLADLEASGSTAGIDLDCAKTQLATLSNEQLEALRDAKPDSTDPKVAAAAFVLLDCLTLPDATATSGS